MNRIVFSLFLLLALTYPLLAQSTSLPGVPEVGKACPIDMPNCCDSNFPDAGGACCPVVGKEFFYASDKANCRQQKTDCRYSDTGELDLDCCQHTQMTPGSDCCQAFPDQCSQEQFVPNRQRSLLTTDDGRNAYDADYKALQSGQDTPDQVQAGGADQSQYNWAVNTYQQCVDFCQSNAHGTPASQPDCSAAFPGCDCATYLPNCLQGCTVSGGQISCSSISGLGAKCVQIIQGCEGGSQGTDDSAAIAACIQSQCAKFTDAKSDVINARAYAVGDYADEKNAQAQLNQPPILPNIPPPGPLTHQFDNAKNNATQAVPDQYFDPDGRQIYANDIKGGLDPANLPYAKVQTPVGDVAAGQSVDIPLQPGFIPSEAIFTASQPIKGGEVSIEGTIPAPLWNTASKPLFTDGLPTPDGEVQQYFKVTTTGKDPNSLQDIEEADAYKSAYFKWAISADKLQGYTPHTLQYGANGWTDVPTELSWCEPSSNTCFYVSDPQGAGVYAVVLEQNSSSFSNDTGSGPYNISIPDIFNSSSSDNGTWSLHNGTWSLPSPPAPAACCTGPAVIVMLTLVAIVGKKEQAE